MVCVLVCVLIGGWIFVLGWNRFLTQEVNHRKRTEARLQESEERFRSIYEQAAVGLANVTLDGKFLKLNPRFCEMLGYSQEELLAKTVLEITHPDDRARILPAMQSLISGEVPYFFQEKQYLRQDGSCFWSSTSVSLVRDGSGNPKHALAVIRDLSDRKKAEAALQESEIRYRKVVEAQSDFILRSLPDTTITFANKTLCRALRNSLEDILGKKWSDFANPDDLQESAFKALAQLNPTNPRFVYENRDDRADGQVRWTQWLNEGIFNESGQLVEIR